MKIAIVGYGKMGKIIEKIAIERGHQIVSKLNETPDEKKLNQPDVVIEFSQPEVAFENIKNCIELGIPVISGTTGWLEKKQEIEQLTIKNHTAFLYASNFSLGVNLFFALNEKVAQMMQKFSDYQLQLEEIHHIHKKDAPSGTAITLAEGVMKNYSHFSDWKLGQTSENQLGIEAVREGEVPGTHKVYYRSEVDEIQLKHTAFNRNGFALGAVVAAEWILGKEGNFSMKDVLELK